MSEFNASALLSNIKRIQPLVIASRETCVDALAIKAHDKLADELATIVEALENGTDLDDIEWFWNAHHPIALLKPLRVSVQIQKDEMPNLPKTPDTSIDQAGLGGLPFIIAKLKNECELRFVVREVVCFAAEDSPAFQ